MLSNFCLVNTLLTVKIKGKCLSFICSNESMDLRQQLGLDGIETIYHRPYTDNFPSSFFFSDMNIFYFVLIHHKYSKWMLVQSRCLELYCMEIQYFLESILSYWMLWWWYTSILVCKSTIGQNVGVLKNAAGLNSYVKYCTQSSRVSKDVCWSGV